MMHTTQSLMRDLSAMGLKGDETLLVHSSMKSIGDVNGGADAVLDAFQRFFASGLLVFPTFTYATVTTRKPLFDAAATHSNVGILPELFWQRPDVLRSNHPTHSLAATGKGAKELCTGAENYDTIYNPASSWGFLLQHNVKILMVGVSLDSCTFIHAIEEWSGVPVLSKRPIIRYVLDANGKRQKVAVHWHTNAHWRNYHMAQHLLEDAKALRPCRFGDAPCLLMDGPVAYRVLGKVLKDNPNYFGKPNRCLKDAQKTPKRKKPSESVLDLPPCIG